MPRARANGIEIEYASIGPSDGRPLLLLRGLGTQMIHWDPRLCEQIVEAGHRLIIFDNRDVGLSSHFSDAGSPDLGAVLAALAAGDEPEVPYRLKDLANDVVGLMDALGYESAHLAGISMGGMIVQQVAIDHPRRVRSLTSVMSTTSEPNLPGPTPEAQAALSSTPPRERSAYIAHTVENQRCFTGKGFPFDEKTNAQIAGRAFDRAFDPDGVTRQAAAVMASGSRHEALAQVRIPTLVIHGSDDPLIPVAGGAATARAISGARLQIVDGMGHDLPEGSWPQWVPSLAAHTNASEP
ncbi:alpha/beta fold hydrolase [Myxococcota bacterium]|nr:alpha/beta fold hydrolase [Myxococcota bacterium]